MDLPRRALHGAGTKTFHHEVVGHLELAYQSVDLVSHPGLSLSIYAAEPATRSARGQLRCRLVPVGAASAARPPAE